MKRCVLSWSKAIRSHGIRTDDQWRICFTWTDAGLEGVEIVDYH